jgi:tRNA splicing ligase
MSSGAPLFNAINRRVKYKPRIHKIFVNDNNRGKYAQIEAWVVYGWRRVLDHGPASRRLRLLSSPFAYRSGRWLARF